MTDTLASVVKDAPNLNALPAGTPPYIRALLDRCLRKDVKTRLRDMARPASRWRIQAKRKSHCRQELAPPLWETEMGFGFASSIPLSCGLYRTPMV